MKVETIPLLADNPKEAVSTEVAGGSAILGLRSASYVGLIGGAILLTTALHFLTPRDQLVLHEFYQRFYYAPIIVAALVFGWRGGLLAALCASLAYWPHIWLHWQHLHYQYAVNQYAEIALFHLVGGLVGLLGDRRRRAQARAAHATRELQSAYAELRQTFEQLLQADRLTSLGELASSLAHEIRNPLASIKGAVEIMTDELAPASPRREFAALAQREVERLDALVSDFLRYARPAPPVKQEVDLNELVRAVAALLEQRAQSQQVTVTLNLDSHLRPVLADAGQIKQVLLNLALNALQAMPEGGTLTLCSHAEAEFASVEVADTGSGIALHDEARIFDPFFTTKDKGTGLGLSIAYKIVRQHGGGLVFRNVSGGTLFQLSLPSHTTSARLTLEKSDAKGQPHN